MENKDTRNELNNMKYKTLLLNGTSSQDIKNNTHVTKLDSFLENEKQNSTNEPWCKLNKTIKTKKLEEFVVLYEEKHNLNKEESSLLLSFLKDCIDRKKLQKVKDVLYDKENGVIQDIPGLHYIKSNKHFTLKNIDKRVSTLKSLAPKKNHGTIRNKCKTDHTNENE